MLRNTSGSCARVKARPGNRKPVAMEEGVAVRGVFGER